MLRPRVYAAIQVIDLVVTLPGKIIGDLRTARSNCAVNKDRAILWHLGKSFHHLVNWNELRTRKSSLLILSRSTHIKEEQVTALADQGKRLPSPHIKRSSMGINRQDDEQHNNTANNLTAHNSLFFSFYGKIAKRLYSNADIVPPQKDLSLPMKNVIMAAAVLIIL
jgi:hypothetical protein